MRGVTWRAVTSKSFFDMPTLKALASAMLTRHWYDVGAETGWEEKAVIEHFQGKCSFYSLSFFNHMLSTAVFISCTIFLILTYPRDTGFNLLYIDFSFSEIGVRLAFHRVIFFAYTLALQVFEFGFGLKTWDCTLNWTPNGDIFGTRRFS